MKCYALLFLLALLSVVVLTESRASLRAIQGEVKSDDGAPLRALQTTAEDDHHHEGEEEHHDEDGLPVHEEGTFEKCRRFPPGCLAAY